MREGEMQSGLGESACQGWLTMRTIVKFHCEWFALKISAQHDAEKAATGDEPVPVLFEMEACGTLSFVCRKHGGESSQSGRLQIHPGSPDVDPGPTVL